MNTLHLKYAVEVERTGSISRAADNLFMGQPNLSKAIRELEESIGVTIFKRTSKGVTATPEGQEFLIRARQILNKIEEIEALKEGKSALHPRFTLTVPDSNYIAAAVSSFIYQIKDDTDVTVKMASAIEGITNVNEGITNLAIIRYETVYDSYFAELLRSRGIKSEAVWSFDAILLASHLSELSRDIPITRDMLKSYTEITYGDIFTPKMKQDNPSLSEPHKSSIKLDDREVSLSLLSQMRYAYMVTAPVPGRVLDRYGLVERRCDFEKRYTDLLIFPADYKLTDKDHQFLNALYAAKNEIAYRQIR